MSIKINTKSIFLVVLQTLGRLMLVFIATSFLSGCATKPSTQQEAMGSTITATCELPSRMITSSSVHIIFGHKFADMDKVNKAASGWCEQQPNKNARIERHECTICCRTSFQCR